MTTDDPYELLGVPRDASQERIRRAYELEVARAHRDGAIRHTVDLSAAFDTLSSPAARALYDRHGIGAVRERSPGATPPPTPWRIAKQQPLAQTRPRGERRAWQMPVLAVFCLGIVAGLILAVYIYTQAHRAASPPTPAGGVQPVREHQVLCESTVGGQGYVYSEPATHLPHCRNGARPRVLG